MDPLRAGIQQQHKERAAKARPLTRILAVLQAKEWIEESRYGGEKTINWEPLFQEIPVGAVVEVPYRPNASMTAWSKHSDKVFKAYTRDQRHYLTRLK